MRAGKGALTDPAVHDVSLNDGTLPAEVFCHGGAAHLQVLYLWGGPNLPQTPRLSMFTHEKGLAEHQSPPTPASLPRVCQAGTSRQTVPFPPASISPAASLPDAERAQPLPHLKALLAAEAGPEGCWIRTVGKKREEASLVSTLLPHTDQG